MMQIRLFPYKQVNLTQKFTLLLIIFCYIVRKSLEINGSSALKSPLLCVSIKLAVNRYMSNTSISPEIQHCFYNKDINHFQRNNSALKLFNLLVNSCRLGLKSNRVLREQSSGSPECNTSVI